MALFNNSHNTPPMGGLNNLSSGIMRTIGGIGGNGGANILGSLGSLGGLGNLGNLAGLANLGGLGGQGGNGLGSLASLLGGGGLGNLAGMLTNNSANNASSGADLSSLLKMAGNFNQSQAAASPDLSNILGVLQNSNIDIGAIINNLQPKTEPAANFSATNNSDFSEQDSAGKQSEANHNSSSKQEYQDNDSKQSRPDNSAANQADISQILQMLGGFVNNAGQNKRPNPQARPNFESHSNAKQQKQAAAPSPPPAFDNCDNLCFNCQANCPRAGLKLPTFYDVQNLAANWQVY